MKESYFAKFWLKNKLNFQRKEVRISDINYTSAQRDSMDIPAPSVT
jgi:hypothetical protein